MLGKSIIWGFGAESSRSCCNSEGVRSRGSGTGGQMGGVVGNRILGEVLKLMTQTNSVWKSLFSLGVSLRNEWFQWFLFMSNFAMRHLSSPAGAWDDVSIRAFGFLSWEKPPRRSWFSIACQHLLNHFLGHSVRNCILLEITDWMNTPPKESKKCKTYFFVVKS